MAGNIYIPQPPNPWAQSMNQVGALLQNLVLAKIAQDFREKEAEMEFERKKILLEEAKAEAKTGKEEERKFQVELAGGLPVEPRLTPMGMVAPSEVVDPETRLPEKTIRIGQQT